MSKVIRLNENIEYIGEYDSVKRSNLSNLKLLIERLKLPDHFKKEITKNIKKDQT